jgi:phage tail protein X
MLPCAEKTADLIFCVVEEALTVDPGAADEQQLLGRALKRKHDGYLYHI